MIRFVQPSSPVGLVELSRALSQLKRAGFEASAHPQVKRKDGFFAGTDAERARALVEAAYDPKVSVVWSARGGYGAFRLLGELERVTRQRGRPQQKTYVGYSDSTALFDFLAKRWHWKILHAPMPGLRDFHLMSESQWLRLLSSLSLETGVEYRLKPLFPARGSASRFSGELRGGNLATLVSLLGSPFFPDLKGSILFLEDVDESLYRIDRYIAQLTHAGAFKGVRAVVLGTFSKCNDGAPMVLKRPPRGDFSQALLTAKKSAFKPIRPVMTPKAALQRIFESLKIPVFYGVSVGHGLEGQNPLWLYQRALLTQSRLTIG